MYRGSGFQQQNYTMRQESWSSTNGHDSNVTGWPMTTSPCQLSSRPVMVKVGYGSAQQQGSNIDCFDDMSHFSHSGKLNNLVVSKTNATMGAGSGYGTYYDESFLDNSHGFSGHVPPFGQVVSQLPHGGKFNNFVVSDGYRTYQTDATRAGGGGGGYRTYFDENFLNNIKTQEMGYEYDGGWGSSGSQHCLTNNPNGFQKGNQNVEYWASKGV
ncbi:unnamed protein product [Camellia sinensis]